MGWVTAKDWGPGWAQGPGLTAWGWATVQGLAKAQGLAWEPVRQLASDLAMEREKEQAMPKGWAPGPPY